MGPRAFAGRAHRAAVLVLVLLLGVGRGVRALAEDPGLQAQVQALLGAKDGAARIAALADGLGPRESLALLRDAGPRLADPAQGRLLLARAARLGLLLGDYPGAASDFEAAATLGSGARDYGLLLLAARCRLAAGESDRAAEIAAEVGRAGTPTLQVDANLVAAWAALLAGRSADLGALLAGLLEGTGRPTPGSPERREALFIAWAAALPAARTAVATRLAAEYPESAEAAIASGAPGRTSLSPLPYWYLSGLVGSGLVGSGLGPAGDAPPPGKASPAPIAPPTPAPAATPADDKAPRRFQVGVFGEEARAAELAATLGKKGFAAKVEKKVVSGKELWAVVVVGPASETVLRLKDSGYEAWPLF